MCVYIYIYIYIHIDMYTYTHIYIYTFALAPSFRNIQDVSSMFSVALCNSVLRTCLFWVTSVLVSVFSYLASGSVSLVIVDTRSLGTPYSLQGNYLSPSWLPELFKFKRETNNRPEGWHTENSQIRTKSLKVFPKILKTQDVDPHQIDWKSAWLFWCTTPLVKDDLFWRNETKTCF